MVSDSMAVSCVDDPRVFGPSALSRNLILFYTLHLNTRYTLYALSHDRRRTFIAAADAGTCSAAGRGLNRAQSMVSQTLANLEAQTGACLFERTGCYPVLRMWDTRCSQTGGRLSPPWIG